MATRLQWNQIKPDFSNSAASMRNAMTGISEAGTVFDKIRDDIAAEEQAALEAAYKQQVFDENVRQFDLEQAWNRENAEAGRQHAIYIANLNHKNAKELQAMRQAYEDRDKTASASLHKNAGEIARQVIAGGGSLQDANKAAQDYFFSNNNGKYAFDPKRIFTTDQIDNLGVMNDKTVKANKYFDNLVEGAQRMGDTYGSELRRTVGSATYDPKLTDFISSLGTDETGNTYIIDKSTKQARPLTESETQTLQNYRNTLQKEANTYSFLDSINTTPEQAYNTFKSINKSAIGLENVRDSVAHMWGVEPSKIGPQDISDNAAIERDRTKKEEQIKFDAEIAKANDLKPKAYTTVVSDFGKHQINKMIDGKTNKINVSNDAQVLMSNAAELFKAAKVPASVLKQFANSLAAMDEKNVNSIFSSDYTKTANNEALRIINTYRTGKGLPTVSFTNLQKDTLKEDKVENERPQNGNNSGSPKTEVKNPITVGKNQAIVDQLKKERDKVENKISLNTTSTLSFSEADPAGIDRLKTLSYRQKQIIDKIIKTGEIKPDELSRESLDIVRDAIVKSRIPYVGVKRSKKQEEYMQYTDKLLEKIDNAYKYSKAVAGKLSVEK